jgi:hypothetical protein
LVLAVVIPPAGPDLWPDEDKFKKGPDGDGGGGSCGGRFTSSTTVFGTRDVH